MRFNSTALSRLSQPNGQLSSKDAVAIKSVVCCHRYCIYPDWCHCRHRRHHRHRHSHWWRSIKCTYIARYAPCIPHHSSDSTYKKNGRKSLDRVSQNGDDNATATATATIAFMASNEWVCKNLRMLRVCLGVNDTSQLEISSWLHFRAADVITKKANNLKYHYRFASPYSVGWLRLFDNGRIYFIDGANLRLKRSQPLVFRLRIREAILSHLIPLGDDIFMLRKS